MGLRKRVGEEARREAFYLIALRSYERLSESRLVSESLFVIPTGIILHDTFSRKRAHFSGAGWMGRRRLLIIPGRVAGARFGASLTDAPRPASPP